MKKTVFSAMRPTGRLHLGHWVGALTNWLDLQQNHTCIFSIVDWHAFMGEYEQSGQITENIRQMAIDWLACGIDPERSTIFIQSQVPEHLELQMIFACITPLGWLERNPTYKEQLREITSRDLQTYGFLGYPVLQAADILLYRANAVPIGEDQLPHVELTREISRRFNHIFNREYFEDCEAILTQTPRLLGLDGRKMSKSYNNAINLSDDPQEILKKVKTMITDPQRIKLTDPGHPEVCNVYEYYKIFAQHQSEEVYNWCTKAEKGCSQCKQILADNIVGQLKEIHAKRKEFEQSPGKVDEILHAGKEQARKIARQTIAEIKEIIF
ncbi:MAG: tryptophan--tRNA ligase [Candidatus Omnitrophica bacterium]|nr:tryptophan--tRNA ligase [Candidatus Omnitrophota bacterium]